jgi:hypothetical protein
VTRDRKEERERERKGNNSNKRRTTDSRTKDDKRAVEDSCWTIRHDG